jgi:hypothetical protein
MKKILTVTMLFGLLAIGCASTGPPLDPKALTEAEAEIRAAESAGAEQLAADLLGKSRRSLDAAKRASAGGNGEEARRWLEEARAYAYAAENQAHVERLRADVARLKGEADELEMRSKQIRERARGGASR